MAEYVERHEVQTVTPTDGSPAVTKAAGYTDRVSRSTVASRIVWLITSIIMGLLAIRFLLSLLGANRGNGFADLIYALSYPFAAPFFGLFGYTAQYGRSRFEFETLVAILVYGLLGALIAKIVSIRSRTNY